MKKSLRLHYEALRNARMYGKAKDMDLCKIWLERAEKLRPISEMQWFHLGEVIGPYRLEELKEVRSLV